jgi:hypothetical protein
VRRILFAALAWLWPLAAWAGYNAPPGPSAPCLAVGWNAASLWTCYVTGLPPFVPAPNPAPTGVRPTGTFLDAIGRASVVLVDPSGVTASIAAGRMQATPEESAQIVTQSPNPSLQCPFVSAVSTTASTTQITGIAGKRLHLCTVFLMVAGAENLGVIEGTGTTCGTGTTNLIGQGSSGSAAQAANGGFVLVSDRITVPMQVTGDSICVVKNASNNVSGAITYGIFP